MTATCAVGIDLGGTNARVLAVDGHGRIAHRLRQPSRPERGPEVVMDSLASMVAECAATLADTGTAIECVGIGAPGPLSVSKGVVFATANLPGWSNVALRNGLARRTGLPVTMDNDANAATYGEFWRGAGRGARHMAMLTLGTGVGGGVMVDGELLHGHHDNAGELGHTIVRPGGLSCACGQRGCLEQYASAAGIVRRAERAVSGNNTTGPSALRRSRGRLVCEDVERAARAGDTLAMKVWDEACYYLAVACINIQHSYNSERMVLGGGMSGAGSFLLEGVQRHAAALRWRLADDHPQIILAELGADAGAIGAAGLALQAVTEFSK